jgi:GT2 family glycosyltransferase
VNATVRYLLETQTLKPACIIVSCVTPTDAGDLVKSTSIRVITGPVGLTKQRNAALAALPAKVDVIVFFDDDFVAERDWLIEAARVFRDCAEVVGVTGRVIADDVKGPGLTFTEATRLVETTPQAREPGLVDPFSPYGCNMAFRVSAISDLRFDERLVLYSWLEDRDFGAALAKRGGRLVKCAGARGVHMGVKTARIAGDRLGYSQVINPIYMMRKGTMTAGQVASQIFRNMASNVARGIRPEFFIDRRGRLRGNLLGMRDVLLGRIEPERAADITPARER